MLRLCKHLCVHNVGLCLHAPVFVGVCQGEYYFQLLSPLSATRDSLSCHPATPFAGWKKEDVILHLVALILLYCLTPEGLGSVGVLYILQVVGTLAASAHPILISFSFQSFPITIPLGSYPPSSGCAAVIRSLNDTVVNDMRTGFAV